MRVLSKKDRTFLRRAFLSAAFFIVDFLTTTANCKVFLLDSSRYIVQDDLCLGNALAKNPRSFLGENRSTLRVMRIRRLNGLVFYLGAS